jgi:hypothetical protein
LLRLLVGSSKLFTSIVRENVTFNLLLVCGSTHIYDFASGRASWFGPSARWPLLKFQIFVAYTHFHLSWRGPTGVQSILLTSFRMSAVTFLSALFHFVFLGSAVDLFFARSLPFIHAHVIHVFPFDRIVEEIFKADTVSYFQLLPYTAAPSYFPCNGEIRYT